jgi:hypothetical protein
MAEQSFPSLRPAILINGEKSTFALHVNFLFRMEEEKPEINTVEESETAKNEDKDTEPVENNEADVAKDSGDTDNREEDAKTELRFLVPNRCAGALIGKGGERIKKLHVTVCLKLEKRSTE